MNNIANAKNFDTSEPVPESALHQEPDKATPDDVAMATTHAAMIGIWDKEADRFWVRNNLMLIANGLLFGGAIAAGQDPTTKFLVCLFGLFFSWMWLIMNRKSGHYVVRWRPVIEMYESEMLKRPSFPVLPLTHVRPDREASKLPKSISDWFQILAGVKRTRMSAGKIMRIVIIGFIIAWIILGFLYGLSLANSPAENISDNSSINTQGSIKTIPRKEPSGKIITPLDSNNVPQPTDKNATGSSQ